MMNRGFVDGSTQTRLPWDSGRKPYVMVGPTIWFHEVFRADGSSLSPCRNRPDPPAGDVAEGSGAGYHSGDFARAAAPPRRRR